MLRKLLKDWPPAAVGLARGILEGAVMGGLLAAGTALAGHQVPAWVLPYTPALLVVVRSLEGAADHIDPTRDRAPEGG